MRSSSLLVLVCVALAMVAFAPVASASANLTMYSDSSCTQPLDGGTVYLDLPSPSCTSWSTPTSSGSAGYSCSSTGGVDNFSLGTWTTATNCTGPANVSITVVGKDGACVPMTMVAYNVTATFYATVQCSANNNSQSKQEQHSTRSTLDELAHTVKAAHRATRLQDGMARLGRTATRA